MDLKVVGHLVQVLQADVLLLREKLTGTRQWDILVRLKVGNFVPSEWVHHLLLKPEFRVGIWTMEVVKSVSLPLVN